MAKLRQHIIKLSGLGVLLLSGMLLINIASASAASAFNPGRIIDDAVFTNYNSMNTSQIQNFLNSKVPSCDTQGNQPYNSTMNRREYAASRGVSTPFICLKDYHEHGKSAAQIINDTAKEFRINPQVLIVLMQKEQGLVTDDWPWPIQYRSATGYGCPDTAPCQSEYYGLTNQLRWAARMFRAIMNDDSSWYTPYNLGNNQILWHPNSSCGTSTVNIQNRATKALYNYTPYRPNQAALNAGYGTGDNCSSYGNRNFFLYFRDWFGNPHASVDFAWARARIEVYADANRTQRLYESDQGRYPTLEARSNQKLYIRVSAQNNGYQAWDRSFLHLGTSHPYDRASVLRDESWLSANRLAKMTTQTVNPGGTAVFEFSIKAPAQTGTYKEQFGAVAEGRRWLAGGTASFQISVTERAAYSNTKDTLNPGESLLPDQYLLSRDRNHIFRFHNNGNLFVRNDFQLSNWETGARPNAGRLTMQADGNLVLYSKTNTVLWASNTDGNPGARLTMQADGNLVMYRADGSVLNTGAFPSGTSVPLSSGNYYINRYLFRNYVMHQDQQLFNPDRSRRLVLQRDGNLVLYDRNNRALWATGTNGRDGYALVFQNNGVLSLRNKNNATIWSTNSGGKGGQRLTMHDNGRFFIYAGSNRIWGN